MQPAHGGHGQQPSSQHPIDLRGPRIATSLLPDGSIIIIVTIIIIITSTIAIITITKTIIVVIIVVITVIVIASIIASIASTSIASTSIASSSIIVIIIASTAGSAGSGARAGDGGGGRGVRAGGHDPGVQVDVGRDGEVGEAHAPHGTVAARRHACSRGCARVGGPHVRGGDSGGDALTHS